VAPLLVLLPFVVGQGETDYNAIAFLTAKATLGFGSVVWLGSSVLSKIFALVAQARSTDTFVALCLLVSVSRLTVQRLLFTSQSNVVNVMSALNRLAWVLLQNHLD